MTGEIERRWGALRPGARLAVSSILIAALWLGMLSADLRNEPHHGYVRGGTADWMVATEATHGQDAYRDLNDLAGEYFDWVGVLPNAPHPRPPSTILLLIPLALVPGSMSIVALALISAPALAVFVRAIVQWLSLPPTYEFLVVPIAVSLPVAQGVVWGTHVPLVAAALGAALLSQGTRDTRRGVMVGLAASLKVFPIALALSHRRGRIQAIAASMAVILILTGLGLFLPGVSLNGAIEANLDAPGNFGGSPTDFSINRFFDAPPAVTVLVFVAGLALIVLIARWKNEVVATSSALILMLLFSPFAWPEYLLLLAPAFFALLAAGKIGRWLAIAAWVGLSLTTAGAVLFMVCTALLVAVLALPSLGTDLATPVSPRDRMNPS